MSDDTDALPFTGERFTPECVREIWYEHWHRYAFARRFAADRNVLDAACGEGYGSALLAGVASAVTGVDIDPASIAHARSRYPLPGLKFEIADATTLPFDDGQFDVVVSFETLEHLVEQEKLLAGFARVLRDDGVLIISSPDKQTYGDQAGFRNEFHVRELYREELLALLAGHFPHVQLYGQKLLFQSALWRLDAVTGSSEAWTATNAGGSLAPRLDYAPMYFVAVCAKTALPQSLPALSLFGDREEAVYAHYNQEIRKNMGAGVRIAELEAEVGRLRSTLDAPSQPAPGERWWRRKRPTE